MDDYKEPGISRPISQRFLPKQVVQMATCANKHDWLFHKQQYDGYDFYQTISREHKDTHKIRLLSCDLYNIHVMWSFPDRQVIIINSAIPAADGELLLVNL